jgi:hypothetical protein
VTWCWNQATYNRENTLSPDYNTFGKPKCFYIPKGSYFEWCQEALIQWRIEHEYGVQTLGTSRGLDPSSRLILKPDGAPYNLSYKDRSNGKPKNPEPKQLKRRFESNYLGEGVTHETLNDSFIWNMWSARSKVGQTQARRDIIAYTGLSASTVKQKTIKEQETIEETLSSLYAAS